MPRAPPSWAARGAGSRLRRVGAIEHVAHVRIFRLGLPLAAVALGTAHALASPFPVMLAFRAALGLEAPSAAWPPAASW